MLHLVGLMFGRVFRFGMLPLPLPLLLSLGGCDGASSKGKPGSPAASNSSASAFSAPVSSLVVDHGELDTHAPSTAPSLAATVLAATVYKLPNPASRRLGYIRLGGVVSRDPAPVSGEGCKKEWFRVYPMGYVCGEDATTNLNEPLVRAAARRPDLSKPLPYDYGFVRATAPQYLRIPTKREQLAREFKLEEHLQWFRENEGEVQRVTLGANDVILDARGLPRRGAARPPGFKASTEKSPNELFGGTGPDDPPPFWLSGGVRQIPNVSGYDMPQTALFADRVRRKTGLSFVGAFMTKDEDLERRFAVTVDLRLIPSTKVKPDTGSPFHGVQVSPEFPMPFAWVLPADAHTYELSESSAGEREALPRRVIVPISGESRWAGGQRFVQTKKDPSRWLRSGDIAIVALPERWPAAAEKGEKWIDISLRQQTMVLFEGKRPWYATLVSTGRDGLGDPEKTLSTPQGEFRLKSKHIAAAMDAEENAGVAGGRRGGSGMKLTAEDQATVARLVQAEKEGKKLSQEDQRRLLNVKKGRHPEYGVTRRRGAGDFELRDVPWIQYFAAGYAIHGAYWHDVFGTPRSHGCVNLSPVDARIVFAWTDPPVPEGWHGINIGTDMGEGTAVLIHE